jgi:hypothetical protein
MPGDEEDRPLPTRDRRSRTREPRQTEQPASFPSLRESLGGARRARSRIPDPNLDPEYDQPQREPVSRYPSRQRRAAQEQWQPEEPVEDFAEYPVEDEGYLPRRETYRQRRSARTTTPRPRPTFQIPAAITTFAAAQDRTFLAQAGIAIVSILLMVVTVSARVGSLPDWIVTHLDAAGRPDQYGTASTVWRLPLMAFFLTVASFSTAFFLAKRDAFLARFLVSSTLLVQALAWIALIRILW